MMEAFVIGFLAGPPVIVALFYAACWALDLRDAARPNPIPQEDRT